MDIDPEVQNAPGITAAMTATSPPPAQAGLAAPVFSRFLRHLGYLELAPVTVPLPEMQWFGPAWEQA